VLDLGCGACAVGRLLVEARLDLHVTGIDAARIAPVMYPRIAVLPRTAMEALPFTERRFDAAVSQFGYEYSRTDETARELARVLAPGANLSFLVHHAGSAIVAATRARLEAIDGLLGSAPRTAFCSGNVAGFGAQIAALLERHPHDSLVTYLARALPPHLVSPQGRRIATWAAIEDALAPERCVSASLLSCCVAEPQLEEWLDPLRAIGEWMPATVIRESNGDPVAWKVEGVCG
jgi:SAM-dependent methyltransferase